MNIKLKGDRLEAEVDKCRGECNWQRLSELLPAIRVKNSGIEHLATLIEGELLLENFLEQERDACFPKENYYDFLRGSETLLQNAAVVNKEKSIVIMEAHLLLAKLYFFSAKFHEALQDIEQSKIDTAKNQFFSLRSVKLAAECYAVKGFSLESISQKQARKLKDSEREMLMMKILSCFETSVELAISYIAELQKTMNSKPKSITSVAISSTLRNIKIGRLLEMALERAPYLSLRKSVNERRWDSEGVEWYRRIMTELSDKSMVEHVQQQLCRQLAEVLMRGMLDSDYEFASRAINLKSKSLSFYTGSNTNYFAPKSRFEEVILLLMISEIIASQIAKVRRLHQHQQSDGINNSGDNFAHVHNLKMVHNLLVFVLSNLRQYNLLSLIYERSMDFARDDRHMWFKFGLTLICDNRFSQAIRTLEHCSSLSQLQNDGADGNLNNGNSKNSPGFVDEDAIIEQMLSARIHLEQLGDADRALKSATSAVTLSTGTWLAGRCMTLFAFALSEKAEREVSFEVRKSLMAESIENFERAIELDSHDELAHFFCALQYALTRNLSLAQERCQRALDLNVENPSALMLMALLFTAKRDYKSALELVINALVDFPTHYGLLVLRLKLEAKYGRIQEALQTSKNLLAFWRKVSTVGCADFMSDASTNSDEHNNHKSQHHANSGMNGASSTLNGANGGETQSTSNTLKTSKHASNATISAGFGGASQKLVGAPVTPLFTSPLGINATSHVSLAASVLDVTDTNSVIGQTGTIATNLSEYGGTISSVTDSLGLLSSSSKSYIRFPVFQIQANIWVELAEFLLEVDKTADVQTCVEEVCGIYPNSYQALYLKGRLLLMRAIEKGDGLLSRRLGAEAKNCLLGALSIFPAHTPSLMFMSRVYSADGNLKMAERMLRNVIEIDPLHFKCWHELGKTLAEDGRIEEANECFQTAGALSFNTPIIPFNTIPRLLKPCLNT